MEKKEEPGVNPYRKKKLAYFILFIVVSISIGFVLSIFTGINVVIMFFTFLFVILPLIGLLLFVYYIISKYFWDAKHFCPKCHSPVSIYSEYCKSCGLKIMIKCPNCGNYIRLDENDECNNCGYAIDKERLFTKTHRPLVIDNLYLSAETSIAQTPEFCPRCGVKLNSKQINLRFCESCGERLV